jgi:hypothetical protein
MTISENPNDIYELARRCPIAALVLADPTGARFHVLTLGSGMAQIEKETAQSLERGLTQQAGLVAMTREGQIESVSKPGFQCTIARAAIVFRVAILNYQIAERAEVRELEKMARLVDPRAQV